MELYNITFPTNIDKEIKKEGHYNYKICSYNVQKTKDIRNVLSNYNKNLFINSDVICIQEGNVEMTRRHKQDSMKKNNMKNINLKLSKNVKNVNKTFDEFFTSNNYMIKDSDNKYYVNLYFYINSYENNEKNNNMYQFIVFPHKLIQEEKNFKLNAIFLNKNIYDKIQDKDKDISAFIGLLDNDKKYRMRHICLGIKYKLNGKTISILNVHLDTNYENKKQNSEFKYCIEELIEKESFFRGVDRLIICGDFNLDVEDLTSEILNSKNFGTEMSRIRKYYITLLFNNAVTRNGLKFNEKNPTGKGNNNGMNLDNIILFDKHVEHRHVISYPTYVGHNRTSGTLTEVYDKDKHFCIPSELRKKQDEKLSNHELCVKYLSDHSPICGIIPPHINKSETPKSWQTKKNISEDEVNEAYRNIKIF